MSEHKKRHLIALVFVLGTTALVWGLYWLGTQWWMVAIGLIASGLLYKIGLAFADGALQGRKKRAAAKVERAKDELHRELTVEDKATMLFPGDDEQARRCRHAYQMGAFDAKILER